MAQLNYIQELKQQAGGRNLSIDWYRKKIRELGNPTSTQLLRDGKRGNRPYVGKLNMFFYDPKLKQKLPYYDIFPLVLPLKFYSDGFLGINFHYLPIPLRVKLLNSLVSNFSNKTKLDSTTRLNVSYDSIGKTSLVKPTLHKYLKTNLRSQFRRIDADEFVIATLLPVQQFRKATANKVWSDSRKMV